VAPFTGTVVATPAPARSRVIAGAPVVVIEAMKMEHEIVAEYDATVAQLHVQIGDTVQEGQTLATITSDGGRAGTPGTETGIPQSRDRPDLEAVWERHALTGDARRPDAVAKRHGQGRRTARENLDDLLDEGSFVEYGPLMFAAQERRRSRE
jgi:pyruvate/2-oxoglutarate dehydrogenase complex dihydrolipoamide acyltransferase (E2) component